MSSDILVVDDDAMNREIMEAFLSGEGYSITLANTGKKGLQYARTELPPLILLDVRLPDVSGYDICRQLKGDSTTQHIAIIIVTGYDADEDVQRAFEAGADDFLARPFDGDTLIERVQKFLN